MSYPANQTMASDLPLGCSCGLRVDPAFSHVYSAPETALPCGLSRCEISRAANPIHELDLSPPNLGNRAFLGLKNCMIS